MRIQWIRNCEIAPLSPEEPRNLVREPRATRQEAGSLIYLYREREGISCRNKVGNQFSFDVFENVDRSFFRVKAFRALHWGNRSPVSSFRSTFCNHMRMQLRPFRCRFNAYRSNIFALSQIKFPLVKYTCIANRIACKYIIRYSYSASSLNHL